MPELPEVETVRGGLAPVLEGHRLTRVEARRPDLRFPLPENFVQLLTGATVTRLERRAKYLLARLDREDTLVMHLGMSGRFEIAGARGADRPGEFHYAADPDPRHAHVVFETDVGTKITYYDPRRFGYMALVNTATMDLHPWFAGLGPEPLSDAFDGDHLWTRSRGRAAAVKLFLMDQAIVGGVGNIYASEALFAAGIHPKRAAGSVSRERYARLAAEVKRILAYAIRRGGTTLRDFISPDGTPGYFEQELAVYGRAGEPCRVCGTPIRASVIGQRSTFHCPRCQR